VITNQSQQIITLQIMAVGGAANYERLLYNSLHRMKSHGLSVLLKSVKVLYYWCV